MTNTNTASGAAEQAAYDLGAKGAPPTESERLLFEAWMRGHCWALCATWDGKGYRSDAERGGFIDPRAMNTRQLWAAWRDRAALAWHQINFDADAAPQPSPTPQADSQPAPSTDQVEEILRERDDAEDFIDVLLDEVLGHERPEWSSAYGRADALNDVQERMTALHKPAVDKAWDQFQSAMAADSVLEDVARYRWLVAHCRSTSEHWGGRWSIVVDGPAPELENGEYLIDEAIDKARKQGANHD